MKLNEASKHQSRKEEQIVSSPCGKNPSRPGRRKSNALFLVVLLAVFIITGIYAFKSNGGILPIINSPFSKNQGKADADVSVKQAASDSGAPLTELNSAYNEQASNHLTSYYIGSKVLTNREGQALKSLIQCTKAVDQAAETVNTYTSSPAGRNNDEYRKALLVAVAVCIDEEQKIADIDVPDQFVRYKKLSISAVSIKKNAFNCWYDGNLTGDSTLTKQGNSYIKQAINIDQQQLDELENYLKANDYKYIRSGDEIEFLYQSD